MKQKNILLLIILGMLYIIIIESNVYFYATNTVAYYNPYTKLIKISMLRLNENNSYFEVALHEYAHHIWFKLNETEREEIKKYLGNDTIKTIFFAEVDSERFARQVEKSCYLRITNRKDTSYISKYPKWTNFSLNYFNVMCK